jgi:hypothetical protein
METDLFADLDELLLKKIRKNFQISEKFSPVNLDKKNTNWHNYLALLIFSWDSNP